MDDSLAVEYAHGRRYLLKERPQCVLSQRALGYSGSNESYKCATTVDLTVMLLTNVGH